MGSHRREYMYIDIFHPCSPPSNNLVSFSVVSLEKKYFSTGIIDIHGAILDSIRCVNVLMMFIVSSLSSLDCVSGLLTCAAIGQYRSYYWCVRQLSYSIQWVWKVISLPVADLLSTTDKLQWIVNILPSIWTGVDEAASDFPSKFDREHCISRQYWTVRY